MQTWRARRVAERKREKMRVRPKRYHVDGHKATPSALLRWRNPGVFASRDAVREEGDSSEGRREDRRDTARKSGAFRPALVGHDGRLRNRQRRDGGSIIFASEKRACAPPHGPDWARSCPRTMGERVQRYLDHFLRLQRTIRLGWKIFKRCRYLIVNFIYWRRDNPLLNYK